MDRPKRMVLSVTEAAELLGISRSLAYDLVARGEKVVKGGARATESAAAEIAATADADAKPVKRAPRATVAK